MRAHRVRRLRRIKEIAEGWREPTELMHHSSTKWATFLMSLKQLVETGTGTPHPRSVTIGDWQ